MEHFYQRIRDKAYELWESEGKPEGKDMYFWLKAERIIQSDIIEEKLMAKDLSESILTILEEMFMRDFFPSLIIPHKKSDKSYKIPQIGWFKTSEPVTSKLNKFRDMEICPRCHSNDQLLKHPNAINSHGCGRCMIEWEGNKIRAIVDGEVFEMEGEL